MINHEIHVLAGKARLNAQTVDNLNKMAFQSNVNQPLSSRSGGGGGGMYGDV